MSRNNLIVYFITITADETNQRIDNFLRTYLKGVPKSMIYRIIRKGEVRVNKKRVKPKYKLKYNDIIRIPPVYFFEKKEVTISAKMDKISSLNDFILYEDNYLIILNKPNGIAVHGGSGFSFGIIERLRILRPTYRFLELVHRLDYDTSGVLLLAKKRSSLVALHEQFRLNKIQKNYLALVHGQWQSNIKKITAPLLKNVFSNGERIIQVNKNGKFSETYFKVEERFSIATLLKVTPVTGRTHQIRVHAQYAGHPVAIDNLYGDYLFNRQIKKCNLNRLFLHSTRLIFEHPNSGEILKIEAPIDSSLNNCLIYLRKYYQ